jgi:hypothetical protein
LQWQMLMLNHQLQRLYLPWFCTCSLDVASSNWNNLICCCDTQGTKASTSHRHLCCRHWHFENLANLIKC